jgi:hypothetical protein
MPATRSTAHCAISSISTPTSLGKKKPTAASRSRKAKKAQVEEKNIEENTQTIADKPRDWRQWVAATAVKNYMMDDPIIDFLEEHGVAHAETKQNVQVRAKPSASSPKKQRGEKRTRSSSPVGDEKEQDENVVSTPPAKMRKLAMSAEQLLALKNRTENPFVSYVMNRGIEFEKSIVEYLFTRYKTDIEQIAESYHARDEEKAANTVAAMKRGVPLLYQGVLHDIERQTYGVVDLLVRSDWLNKLVLEDAITDEDASTPAPLLGDNAKWHYLVVDFKWCTLRLRADGMHLLNSDRFPAYKGQLQIYNEAIGKIQGYMAPCAYLLGRRWSYETRGVKYTGYNRFEKLGVINFSNAKLDGDYKERVDKAIKWIRDVRQDGGNWTLIPPSRDELYPNMSNLHDGRWHPFKEKLAKEIGEITQLWMCGTKNRRIAHKAGIMRWDDEDCTPELLGVKGEITGPTLERILEAQVADTPVIPKTLLNNMANWQNRPKLEFYIDFEFLTDIMIDDVMGDENWDGFIFQAGIGWSLNGKWHYKSFVSAELTWDAERTMMDAFYNHITTLTQKHLGKKDKVANMFHWASAENYQYAKVNERNGDKWGKLKEGWVDLLKIFKDEPIGVRGCLKFGLKAVAKAMHANGLIKTTWSGNCQDGQTAMLEARRCYDEAKRKSISVENMPAMCDIVKYNEIDCKTMWEIVEYLRENHCHEREDLAEMCDDEWEDK